MYNIGDATLSITADLSPLRKGFDEAEREAVQSGGRIESAFSKMAGFGGLAVGAATVAVGAIVGIGVAAYNVGSQFDEAFDTIRVGTGETGDSLEGLFVDFRAVARDVPAEFGDISLAITELNKRTGETGPELQAMATQLLNLSRITGEDLSSAIEGSSRLFNSWGIEVGKQAGSLDLLFRASQNSGIEFGKLQDLLVQSGPILREMGLGFDESVALLASFEKQGVNSSVALAGMRKALSTFNKEGLTLQQGLTQTVKRIQELGPGAEATGLALEVFGTKAGPELASAIASGRFNLEEMLSTIQGGSDTINTAADETADFAEKSQVAMNRLMLAVEPAATAVFGMAGTLVERLTPALESLITAVTPVIAAMAEQLPGALDAVSGGFSLVNDAVRLTTQLVSPVVTLFRENEVAAGALSAVMGAVAVATGIATGAFVAQKVAQAAVSLATGAVTAAQWLLNAALTANPIGLVVVALGALVGALIYAYQNSEDFRRIVDNAFSLLRDSVLRIFSDIQTIIRVTQDVWNAAGQIIATINTNVTKSVSDSGQSIRDGLEATWKFGEDVVRIHNQAIFDFISATWNAIPPDVQVELVNLTNALKTAFDVEMEITKQSLDTMRADFQAQWATIQTNAGNVWNQMTTAYSTSISAQVNTTRTEMETIRSVISGVWDAVSSKTTEIWNGVKTEVGNKLSELIGSIRSWGSGVLDYLRTLLEPMLSRGREIGGELIKGVMNTISSAAKSISDAITEIVKNALKNLVAYIEDWVKERVGRVLSGIGIPSPGGGGGGGGDSGGGGGGISLPDIPDGGNFSRLSGLEGMAAADASGGGVTYNIDIRETDVALTEERLIDTLSRVEYLYR